MYICHVFKEDDIRVNYLPCTYYIKLILAGSVDKCTVYVFFCNMDSERIMFTDIVTDTF